MKKYLSYLVRDIQYLLKLLRVDNRSLREENEKIKNDYLLIKKENTKILNQYHREKLAPSLQSRIDLLESAIRKHRDQIEHNQCWENDLELYEVLKDGGDNFGPHRTLPPREEFMGRCRAYYESRLFELKVKDVNA